MPHGREMTFTDDMTLAEVCNEAVEGLRAMHRIDELAEIETVLVANAMNEHGGWSIQIMLTYGEPIFIETCPQKH